MDWVLVEGGTFEQKIHEMTDSGLELQIKNTADSNGLNRLCKKIISSPNLKISSLVNIMYYISILLI
jgi:hypothetical protein